MRGCSFTIAVSLLVLVAFAVPAFAQDGGDAVRLMDDSWLIDKYGEKDPTREEMAKGKIIVLKEEYDKLYYRFRSTPGTQNKAMSEVKKVLYFKRDSDYDRGVGLMNAQKLQEALEAFTAAKRSRVSWVPQYAMWNIVLLYRGGGMGKEALGAIDDLTRKFPKTKFLVQARELAGNIHLAYGDVVSAKREFEKIRTIPKVDKDVAANVDFLLLYIQERSAKSKSDLESVKGKYEGLLSDIRGKFPTVETKCRQGIGRCLVALGRHEEALAYFQKITKESKDEQVLAGAYLGIGESYFAMQKWVEARRAFLRVAVLWEDSPDHAQALCRAGNCFLLARDTDYKNRARQELKACISRYPGSPWGKQAADLLAQMK